MAPRNAGLPNGRRPSISDVAEMAGVSNSAVSKVIRGAYGVSPLMRAKVEDAIKKLGYRPRTGARSMRGRSQLIGIEIPHLGNEFFTQIIGGVQERLAETPFQLVIAPPSRKEKIGAALFALLDHQVDGIISVAPDLKPNELASISRQAPLVTIGRHDKSQEYDSVVSDDAFGTELAMQHLYDVGHRDIAHVTITPDLDLPDARQPHPIRRDAYEKFMHEHDLVPRVVLCNPLVSEDTYPLTVELLTGPNRPSAIFAGHDVVAMEVLRAIIDCGFTSQEVALVGYDDISLAEHPLIGMSTVRQYGALMGRRAVDLLLERIEGARDTANQLTITPKLMERRTSVPVTK